MLKVYLESNNVLVFEKDSGEKKPIIYKPEFGTDKKDGDVIRFIIKEGALETPFAEHYSNIEVDGTVYLTVIETLSAINKLCEVFKKGGGGGGVSPTVHNDLTGRNASNCHPINAITGLQSELQNINNEIGAIVVPDVSGKMDKVSSAVNGNAAIFDSSGQVIDAGISPLCIYHVPSPTGLNETAPFVLAGKKKGFYYFEFTATAIPQDVTVYLQGKMGGTILQILNSWKCVALEIVNEIPLTTGTLINKLIVANFWDSTGKRRVISYTEMPPSTFILTSESAAELFVGKQGDQIIEGIKTFNKFPVLPTTDPTTIRQAAHKQYVDNTLLSSITATSGTINARIDSLENKGLFVGAFDTKAMIPTNVSAFAAININDFVNVRADETQGGATTQYIATAITGGIITWTFNFKYSIDITGKMNLVPSALAGNIAKFNNLGQVIDGGEMPTVDRIPIIKNIRFKKNQKELTVDFSKPLVLESGETAYLQYARYGRGSRNRASQFRWIKPLQQVNASDMAAKGITKWVKIDITNTDADNGYVVISESTLDKLYFPPLVRGGQLRTWLQWSATQKGTRHNNDNNGNKYHRRDSKVFYKFRIVVDNGTDLFIGKESMRTLKIQEYIQTVGNGEHLVRKYEIK